MPAMAARALRVRCKASGTLPNSIARDLCSAYYMRVIYPPWGRRDLVSPSVDSALPPFWYAFWFALRQQWHRNERY
jgi:hypothetical protein